MEPKWYSITQNTCSNSQIEERDITLRIHQFSKMLRTQAMLGDCLMKYSIFQVPDSPFRLKLVFLGWNNELMNIYYITNSSIFVKHKLNIEFFNDSSENCRYRVFDKNYEIKNIRKVLANKWQHCAVVLKANEYNYIKLILHFKFTISLEAKAEHEVNQTELCDDFGILLTDGSYSDVTIKSAEGVEFKVHKNILAIRSAVLKAHFDHNMRESTTNIVETTWETEVLRDVLIYVYTGTAPRVDNDPVKLLAAADYYQLQGLKAHCETALYKRLTVENAIETLELAEQYAATKLFDDTLAFIKDGRVKLMFRTESWSKLQSISILKKLSEVTLVDEDDIVADKLEEAYEELGEEIFK